MAREFLRLSRAWRVLMGRIAQGLRLPQCVDWLANKLEGWKQ